MTTYKLIFLRQAQKEWDKLNKSVRDQFTKKLRQRLVNPRITGSRLRELPDCYKIKLRSVGYRLIYQVRDDQVKIVVIAVGRRDHDIVYNAANDRISKTPD
ncbi:type II toxin-antitoxin system RelE/ParE family toxin [Blastomonas sp.]|uniref:type II toxin-antitoxin system RelE family toxin n=1 Tax=Blastomonas sp. TaxID=1909299 RepID=UPI003593FBF8